MPQERDPHFDALAEAWERLSKLDPSMLASRAGGSLVAGRNQISLRVLDKDCVVDLGKRTVDYVDGQPPVIGDLQVILLHYLEGSLRSEPSDKLVSFREFEGGALYYAAFKSRTIDFLVRTFGQKTDRLQRIGDLLKGERMSTGTVGFKVNFFPKVSVAVVMWLGDEEVPTSANILFDANAGTILPTEDISHMGGLLCLRLAELEKSLS